MAAQPGLSLAPATFVAYRYEMELFEQAAMLLGGPKVLGKIPHDPVAAAIMIRAGFPPAALDSLRTKLGTSWEELEKALNLGKRTLQRRLSKKPGHKEKRLTDAESERLYRFARVIARAREVFGDLEKAFRWLRKENRALGGERPMMLLDTDVGTTAVEDVLTRIEYGVFP